MKQNQFKFKPFDHVLVRDGNGDNWKADVFSHINEYFNYTNTSRCRMYCCITGNWEQCIPYNENTECLIGTNEPYKKPEEKEWCVYDSQSGFEGKFTSEELIKFVTQQINNKDLCRFTIIYTSEVHNHDQCTCEMCNDNQPY